MSISLETINVGAENQATGSDSIYAAFQKTKNNFATISSLASTYTNFVGSNGVSVSSNPSTGTVSFFNTGIIGVVAGTGISTSVVNGVATLSVTGYANGNIVAGVTSVSISSNSLSVSGSPIISNGTLTVDLPIIPTSNTFAPGTYTAPTITVDQYGRITGTASASSAGTVTSIDVVANGTGLTVVGAPITTTGTIYLENTGVTKLNAGPGIGLSSQTGVVTIYYDNPTGGTVTSVGVTSNTLTVAPNTSPVTTYGDINIEIPSTLPIDELQANTVVAADSITGNTIVANISIDGGNSVSANYFIGDGGYLTNVAPVRRSEFANVVTDADQPNITSLGTLSSLDVTANTTTGNLSSTGIIRSTGNITSLGNIIVTGSVASTNKITANTLLSLGNFSGNLNSANLSTTSTSALGIRAGFSTYTDNVATASSTVTSGAIHGLAAPNVRASNSSVTYTSLSTLYIAGSPVANANVTITNAYALQVNSGNVLFGGNLSTTGNINSGNLSTSGSITSTGNLTSGNITTTGISSTTLTASGNISGGNISSGGIITSTGNLSAGNLSTAGELSVSGNITIGGTFDVGPVTATSLDVDGNITFNANNKIYVDTSNVLQVYNVNTWVQLNHNNDQIVYADTSEVGIIANSSGTIKTWTFEKDGTFTAPGNVSISGLVTAGNISTTGNIVASANANVTGNLNVTANATVTGNLTAGNVSTGHVNLNLTLPSVGSVDNGAFALDAANNRIAVKIGGIWKYATLT